MHRLSSDYIWMDRYYQLMLPNHTEDVSIFTDVNECAAKDNPCEGQIGASRCVNIDGGYICCEEDLDNKRCIRGASASN